MAPTYNQAYKFFLYIIIFLNLVKVNAINFIISICLTFLCFLLYLFDEKKEKINKKILVYIILEFILIVFEIIRLNFSSMFPITMWGIFMTYGPVIYLLLVFPLYKTLLIDYKKFFQNICNLGYIILSIKAISWIFYNFFHLNIAFNFFGGSINYNRVFLGITLSRLGGTPLDIFMYILTLVSLLKSYSVLQKGKEFIKLIFLLIYIGIIFQSRSLLLGYIIVTLVIVFYWAIHNENRVIEIITSTLFFICLIFVFKSNILSFVNSFSLVGQNSESTYIRLFEQAYFSNLWRTNIFWGVGIIPEEIIMSNGLKLYLSDMGIQICLYQFGIIGFIISIIPFVIGVILSIKLFVRKFKLINSLYIGLTAYYLSVCVVGSPYIYSVYLLLIIYITLTALVYFEQEHERK